MKLHHPTPWCDLLAKVAIEQRLAATRAEADALVTKILASYPEAPRVELYHYRVDLYGRYYYPPRTRCRPPVTIR